MVCNKNIFRSVSS